MSLTLNDDSLPWLKYTAETDGLPTIPGGWSQKQFMVGPRQLRLTLPAVPDAFLEDPQVLAENRIDDYMPYWAYLWPISLKMADFFYRRMSQPDKLRLPDPVIEFGCGVGAVGLGLLVAGCEVIFSDYRDEPVQVALYNAHANGFSSCRGLVHDWRNPPPFRCASLVACEVLYEQRNHQPILEFLSAIMTDDGICWIGDPGRGKSISFLSLARGRKFEVEILDERGETQPTFRHGAFQLLKITKNV